MIKKMKWTWKKVLSLIAGFLGIGTLVSCYGVPMDSTQILIRGRVTSSSDNAPIKDICVRLDIDSGFIREGAVYTDEDGYYAINTYAEVRRGDRLNKCLISFIDEDGESNGGYFHSIEVEEEIANNDLIRKDVSLQKLIPITVGGTVVSDEDSTPIKNILVSSNIDKTITDEKGYYELRTCALENEKAKIYFDDDDMYSNGGYFSSDTLEIPLEKDKTFDNNISLKKFVED